MVRGGSCSARSTAAWTAAADQFLEALVDHPCVDLVIAGLVAMDE
jgi:hypothetical protein